MSDNASVFTALADSSFHVELERGGKKMSLKCRELPFMSILDALTCIVTAGQQELISARRQLFEDIVQAGVTGVSPEQVREMAMPLILATVHQTPSIVKDLLLSSVFDSTAENIKYFTLDDTVCILNALVERIDFTKLSEKIRPVFSHAAKTMQKVFEDEAEVLTKQEEAKKKIAPRKFSPQKPSQE